MKYFLAVLMILGISSCRTITPLPHTVVSDPNLREKCVVAGVPPLFRAVHTITATIRGRSSAFIGVTIADIPADRIRATLLSVEGMVLMDAVDNQGRVTIYQALPPFDSIPFAQGLFRDIRFLFFPEHGQLVRVQTGPKNAVACTWLDSDRAVERSSDGSGEAVIREYDTKNDHVLRRVELFPPVQGGFYKRIRMTSSGVSSYSLSFDLLEAEPLGREDGLFSR